MTSATLPPDGDRIVEELLTDALSKRYLAYALSTIMHRALPDVRDGLKPVQRRLLYAMHRLRLDPGGAAKKCAKVVGDVMGQFHPHGDQSIYDALVRLAQDFSQRVPLVDGQGNFGNIDGDNPAAMRYTECRLTEAAALLLGGIDEDAVDFRPTYDGEDEEPVVLPGGFPNLLANGATGIAVGMATSIPPHNVGELLEACTLLLSAPDTTTEALMAHVRGPDFPTGGVIVESQASLLQTYQTGRGGVRVRSRWAREDLGRGGYQIVITEIPYHVKKSDLVEQLAGLLDLKKAPLLGDVRDESAEDIRLVLEPKSRNVEPEVLMESLFRISDLETRFPVNMNVLDARGTPGVVGLKEALQAFLTHRRDVLVRRANHRLGQVEARLHILGGLLIAFLNLDEVIRIVRQEEQPKAKLIATFDLTDIQAEAILNTRLRQLAKLEEMEIRKEDAELSVEREGILAMLASDALQWRLVGSGLDAARAILGSGTTLGKRRSSFADAPVLDISAVADALMPKEPLTVILSQMGWIRAAKGPPPEAADLKFKDGDSLAFMIPADTHDRLVLMAADGRAFTLDAAKLPSARGHGEPVRLMIDLEDRVPIIALFAYRAGQRRLLASSAGYGFIVPEDDLISSRRAGKVVMNGQANVCQPCLGDHVASVGDNGRLLIFPSAELPEMPRGKGVKLQSYRDGGLRDILQFEAATGASWVDAAGRTRAWSDWRDWLGKRGGAGKSPPKGFPATKRFRP